VVAPRFTVVTSHACCWETAFIRSGTKLTQRLGELLALKSESHVLDVASGRGTSGFHLAQSFGLQSHRVDLSDEQCAPVRSGSVGSAEWSKG